MTRKSSPAAKPQDPPARRRWSRRPRATPQAPRVTRQSPINTLRTTAAPRPILRA